MKKKLLNLQKVKMMTIFGLAVFFLSLSFSQAFAEEKSQIGISVDQSRIVFDAEAPSNENFKLKIKNTSQEEEIIKIRSQDIEINDNNEIEILDKRNDSNGLSQWIWINEKELLLKPGGEKDVNFTLNIPNYASSGSHYAFIILQAFPRIDFENKEDVIVSGKIGVHILVNVKGEISGGGVIKNFQSPIFSGKEAQIGVEYENLGNIHYVPHGEMIIKSIFGKEEKITLEKHFVFPGKSYLYKINKSINPYLGSYFLRIYFVDAEGETHSQSRLMFGYLFFPIIFIFFLFLLLFKKFFFKKHKK